MDKIISLEIILLDYYDFFELYYFPKPLNNLVSLSDVFLKGSLKKKSYNISILSQMKLNNL